MKTFQEFSLNELYRNSLPLKIITTGDEPETIFYEKITAKNFDLVQYFASFNVRSSIPGEEYLRYNELRGLIYAYGPGFIVFVFSSGELHQFVSKALDKSKASMKLPNIEYFKEYRDTYGYIANTPISKTWCFPIVYTGRNQITSTMDNFVLENFADKVKLRQRFMLNDAAWDYMLEG